MTTLTTAPRSKKPRRAAAARQAGLARRTRELLQREIDFIPSPDFSAKDPAWDAEVAAALAAAGDALPAGELPPHLARMCRTQLLSTAQERALFREMNYVKFRANALRSRLDPTRLDAAAVDEIERLLARGRKIRDHIVQANLRLVMAIVKKFVTPQQSFDELLSDGTFTLMQAVEKFDYSRGFRFSTYAYRSIARAAYRKVVNAQKEQARYARNADGWAFEQPDERSSSMSEKVWGNLRELTKEMLDRLDRRERLIIRCRYALGPHRKVSTFQSLADKLGVSKERVRQLEQRAVGKLQSMAAELDLDELFGAVMTA